jgi:hypothetical protein
MPILSKFQIVKENNFSEKFNLIGHNSFQEQKGRNFGFLT